MSAENSPNQRRLPTPKNVFPNTYEPIIPGMRESELFVGDTGFVLSEKGSEVQRDLLTARFDIYDLVSAIPPNDPDSDKKLTQIKRLPWVRKAVQRDVEYTALTLRRNRIAYPNAQGSIDRSHKPTDLYTQLPLPIEAKTRSSLKIVDKAA